MRLCVRAAGLGDVDEGEDLGRLADVDTGGGVCVPGKGKRVNNRWGGRVKAVGGVSRVTVAIFNKQKQSSRSLGDSALEKFPK
jgi:hypothetical protein